MKTSSQKYTKLLKQRYLPGRSIYLKYFVYPRIVKRLKKGSLIDMGCVFGDFLKYLSHRGWVDCFGIDSNFSHVEICNAIGLNSQMGDILYFNSKKKFDNAILDNVLEHLNLNEIDKFFSNIKNVLVPKGRLILIVPCIKGQSRDPTHKTYITKSLIERFALKNQMQIVETINLPTPFEFIGKFFYLQMRMFSLDMKE